VKPLVKADRCGLRFQHGRTRLLRGVNRLDAGRGGYLEIVVVKDAAAGVAALYQDPAD
jgi:hypothetical protein